MTQARRCGACAGTGHTRRTCTAPITTNTDDVRKEEGNEQKFVLTLETGGQIYTSEGETILTALENLPSPAKITAKGTLLIEHNGVVRTRLFTPRALKRIFYPTARIFFAKSFSHGFI